MVSSSQQDWVNDVSSRVRELSEWGQLIKTKVIISEGKRQLFSYLLWEYDIYLIKQTRVDFTSQIQIKT